MNVKKVALLLIMCCIFLTGCSNHTEKDIIHTFSKKLENSSGYFLKGDLSINNNDEIYNYNVEVYYKKDGFYKVIFTNIANQHTQVILKNTDGVYVLTPSLNKSFRFQSDWPYQNSQIYLLDALLNDLKKDKSITFEKNENQYIFQTKVQYPNNSKLVNQKIIFSKKVYPKKTIVYDKNGAEIMVMTFDKIKFSNKISKDEFKIDKIIDMNSSEEVKKKSKLEDVIYPLFVPEGTKLVGEEKIKKGDGQRVIMNYDGEKSFVLVEETADVFQEFTIIPTSGEPYQLMDTLGVMTNNSLSWSSDGVEFNIISDVMSKDEMIEVAQSITGIVSMK